MTEARVGSVVQGSTSYESQQGPTYAPGVSAETVGAKSLFLGVVTMAPGARTKSHFHAEHESAFYMVSGEEVDVYTGDRLEHKEVARRATTCSSHRRYLTSWSIAATPLPRSSSARGTSRLQWRASSCCPT